MAMYLCLCFVFVFVFACGLDMKEGLWQCIEFSRDGRAQCIELMLGPGSDAERELSVYFLFWAKLEKQLEGELGKEVDKGLDKVVDVH